MGMDYIYKELAGLMLRRTAFRRVGARDHEHCNLCGTRFAEDEKIGLTWGYATADEIFWICPECLTEEGVRYGWRMTE